MRIKAQPKKRKKILKLHRHGVFELEDNRAMLRLPQLNKHFKLRAIYGARP